MGTMGNLSSDWRREKIFFLPQETDPISHLELFSKCITSFGFLLRRRIYPCANGVL